MKAAVGYIRPAGADAPGDELGRAAQESAIRAYAEAEGLELRRLFVDDEADPDRPALAELLATLEPATVVILRRLDRLDDDVLRQELALRDLRARGAVVRSCAEEEADYLDDDAESLAASFAQGLFGGLGGRGEP